MYTDHAHACSHMYTHTCLYIHAQTSAQTQTDTDTFVCNLHFMKFLNSRSKQQIRDYCAVIY